MSDVTRELKEAQREYDKAQSSVATCEAKSEVAWDKVEELLGTRDPKEAAAKVKALEAEATKAEQKYKKAKAQFDAKWADKFDTDEDDEDE